MKLTNTEIGLHIVMDESLIDRLYQYGKQHYPNEFGGLLVGYYTEEKNTVIISDTILPKAYKASKYSFERGTEGLKEELEKYYRKMPPQIYVGEWHTHPDNPPIPSATDKKALYEIAAHKDVFIVNPILLILGMFESAYTSEFYVLFNRMIYRYEKEK